MPLDEHNENQNPGGWSPRRSSRSAKKREPIFKIPESSRKPRSPRKTSSPRSPSSNRSQYDGLTFSSSKSIFSNPKHPAFYGEFLYKAPTPIAIDSFQLEDQFPTTRENPIAQRIRAKWLKKHNIPFSINPLCSDTQLKTLQKQHSDYGFIGQISSQKPIIPNPNCSCIELGSSVNDISFSPDGGSMFAVVTSFGSLRIFDSSSLKELAFLQSNNPNELYEYLSCSFITTRYVVASGRVTSRKAFDSNNNIHPLVDPSIHVYDLKHLKIIHSEPLPGDDIRQLVPVNYGPDLYLMALDWSGCLFRFDVNLIDENELENDDLENDDLENEMDSVNVEYQQNPHSIGHDSKPTCSLTNRVCFSRGKNQSQTSLAFLPRTGNRLFLMSCDNGIKIYDMETCRLVHSFQELYLDSECDCVFVLPEPLPLNLYDDVDYEDENSKKKKKKPKSESIGGEYQWFNGAFRCTKNQWMILTRGVSVDKGDQYQPAVSRLLKLTAPMSPEQPWTLETERVYTNSHMICEGGGIPITSTPTGESILSATSTGTIFVFNTITSSLTSFLQDHDEPVYFIRFHPTRKLMFIGGCDGRLFLYTVQDSKGKNDLDRGVSKSQVSKISKPSKS